jgi:hypothetical protein
MNKKNSLEKGVNFGGLFSHNPSRKTSRIISPKHLILLNRSHSSPKNRKNSLQRGRINFTKDTQIMQKIYHNIDNLINDLEDDDKSF